MPFDSDRLVLVAAPGAGSLLGLVLLAVGVGGVTFAAMMAGRMRMWTWWPVAPFGALALCALAIFASVPSRLVLDRRGIEATIGLFREHWAWGSVSSFRISRGVLGAWISFEDHLIEASGTWNGRRRTVYFLDPLAIEPRLVEARAKAWQLSASR